MNIEYLSHVLSLDFCIKEKYFYKAVFVGKNKVTKGHFVHSRFCDSFRKIKSNVHVGHQLINCAKYCHIKSFNGKIIFFNF